VAEVIVRPPAADRPFPFSPAASCGGFLFLAGFGGGTDPFARFEVGFRFAAINPGGAFSGRLRPPDEASLKIP
jgi:hypothetical protein